MKAFADLQTVYTVSYGVSRPLALPFSAADDQIYTIACLIASRASNMRILIAFRVIQAVGSAAVVSVGAGSLADMYEPRERGRKVNPACLLKASSLICSSGSFTACLFSDQLLVHLSAAAWVMYAWARIEEECLFQAFGWRSALYFLTAFAGLVWVMFFFFPDTWRKEVSRGVC